MDVRRAAAPGARQAGAPLVREARLAALAPVTLPAWLRAPSWLAVGAAAALTYAAGRREGGMAEREQQAERGARAVLAAGHAYRDSLAALRRAETVAVTAAWTHTRAARAALGRADSLQGVADSLARRAQALQAAQTASGQPDPCAPANEALGACQATGAALRVTVREQVAALAADSLALLAVGQRAGVAEARASAVERSLRDLLAVRECRVLGVRCPSRRVLFVLGVLTGTGAVLVLHP